MLECTLNGVFSQVSANGFTFEVVVVDNDEKRSAEGLVKRFRENENKKIVYDCEPEQNIALARNRAVQNARGNLIAFIDDDEYPEKDWLVKMYCSLKKFQADAVLGPVLPDFPPGAPIWLINSKLSDRRRNPTGSLITNRDKRTGNILFKRNVFKKNDMWFDPARGRTGGEDGEFLGRQMKNGRRFVWCDEALVFETVPEERWYASFYIKKYLRIGTLAGEKLRRNQLIGTLMQTCVVLIAYSIMLPFSFLTRKHIWMKVLAKLCYNVGRLLGFLGLSVLRYRE